MASNELASLFVKIGADVKDFDKGLKSIKSDMSGMEKTSAALGKAFVAAFAIGVTAAVGFTVAIKKTVDAAADMEQQVADIRSVFGKTAPAVEELNAEILKLGLDPKLKVSATQAAEAIEMLGKNGLTMSEIMGGATRNTILLANATGDNFSLAADVATDVMKQFNVSASDMHKAVDGIVGVTQASKFTIEDYALAIAQGGGVASQVGVTLEDFNAVIAATSSSFGSGSDAGTSFKVFLQRLTPDTDKAKEAMAELGLMTAAGGSAFFDASGKMKSMDEIAGLLQGAFGGLSDAQRNSASSTIFGTDAMRTALSLAAGGTATIQKMKDVIGNTSAEEAAATRMDTFRGSMEIAWGIIETLSISIGQKFLPVLRPLIDRFSELAQTYGPALVDFFGSIADKMAGWIAKTTELATGTGDLHAKLMTFWTVAQGVWKTITEFVKPITEVIAKFVTWKDVVTALGLIMGGALLGAIGALVAALWPVIQTIALVTAAVAALRWAWQSDFMGIATFTRNTLDKLKKWFFEDSGIWKGTWEKTLDYLKWWAGGGWKQYILVPIQDHLREMKYAILGFRADIMQRWSQFLIDLKVNTQHQLSLLAGHWQKLSSEVKHWWSEIVRNVNLQINLLKTDFMVWSNGVKVMFRDWKDYIIARFQDVAEWWNTHIQPFINAGRDIVQGLWDGVRQKWNDFTGWFRGVWEDLKRNFRNFFGIHSPSTVFSEFGTSMMDGLAQGIEAASGKVYSAMDVLGKGMTKTFSNTLAPQGAFAPFVSLQEALGDNQAEGILKSLRNFASEANQAFRQYGIQDQSILGHTFNLSDMAAAGSTASIGDLKSAIAAVVGQLNATGVSQNYGANASAGLGSVSDYLGVLLTGGANATPAATPPTGGGMSDEIGRAMLEMLKVIIEVLRKNGSVNHEDLSVVRAYLSNIYAGNSGGVANIAGLAR